MQRKNFTLFSTPPSLTQSQLYRSQIGRLLYIVTMFISLHYAQWILMLVYRIIDLFTIAHIQADHDNNERGHWHIAEFLPLLSMVMITWIIFKFSDPYRSKHRRLLLSPRDLDNLFVEYKQECTKSITASSKATSLEQNDTWNQNTCPICLECFNRDQLSTNQQRHLKSNVCSHVFHEHCIMTWCRHQQASREFGLQKSTPFLTCPCCRHPLCVSGNDKVETTMQQNDSLLRGLATGHGNDPMTGMALGMGILTEFIRLMLHLSIKQTN